MRLLVEYDPWRPPRRRTVWEVFSEIARLSRAYVSFHHHRITQRPYFGDYMASHQMTSERRPYMTQLVQKVCAERNDLIMLEVGSWAGESAVLWADAAKRSLAGRQHHLAIFCVDPWTLYPSLTDPFLYPMKTAAGKDKIYSLFIHNVKTSHHDDVIFPLRTWSNVAARLFPPNLFDMIYIDADHAYASVALDLKSFAPLVRDGGYLCGDDLEIQMADIDVGFVRDNRDRDVVLDARTGRLFHPGVTLAVGEFFGGVSVYAGFWAMQKKGTAWIKVSLS